MIKHKGDRPVGQVFKKQQDCALRIVHLANTLWSERGVLITYHGMALVDEKSTNLIRHLKSSVLESEHQVIFDDVRRIVELLLVLPYLPPLIDVAVIARQVKQQKHIDLSSCVTKVLWHIIGNDPGEPMDVVLYGFGRIGRLLTREMTSNPRWMHRLRLKAVVTRDPVDMKFLRKRASLLMKDSVHGSFDGIVEVDENLHALMINGWCVSFLTAEDPDSVDYSALDIQNALLIDNTGMYRERSQLARHTQAGAIEWVILTAPAKDVPNIVTGVNDDRFDLAREKILSTASCTTNAITPVLHILESNMGIRKGHVESIHSYTNDQNLVDNIHRKVRRGRAAALNMVITETGAGTAVAKAVPTLTGKLTSSAIRVPVANGSLAILILELLTPTSADEINKLLEECAYKEFRDQLQVSYDEELVSTDVIGKSACSIVDATATLVSVDGLQVILYIWYDNEYGYVQQVLRLANQIAAAKVSLPTALLN